MNATVKISPRKALKFLLKVTIIFINMKEKDNFKFVRKRLICNNSLIKKNTNLNPLFYIKLFIQISNYQVMQN